MADAGLLSSKNMEDPVAGGYEYILGARLKNENTYVRRKLLELRLTDGQADSIKTDDGLRIVVSFTDKRRKQDAPSTEQEDPNASRTRSHQAKSAKNTSNNRGYNKDLRLEGETTISTDTETFERDAAWDGIKGCLTNTKLSDEEVLIFCCGYLCLIPVAELSCCRL